MPPRAEGSDEFPSCLPEIDASPEISIRWRGETVTVCLDDPLLSATRDRVAFAVGGLMRLAADLAAIRGARQKDPAGYFGERGRSLEDDVRRDLLDIKVLMNLGTG